MMGAVREWWNSVTLAKMKEFREGVGPQSSLIIELLQQWTVCAICRFYETALSGAINFFCDCNISRKCALEPTCMHKQYKTEAEHAAAVIWQIDLFGLLTFLLMFGCRVISLFFGDMNCNTCLDFALFLSNATLSPTYKVTVQPKNTFSLLAVALFSLWCELQTVGDNNCKDVRLVSGIIKLDGAWFVVLKPPQKNYPVTQDRSEQFHLGTI